MAPHEWEVGVYAYVGMFKDEQLIVHVLSVEEGLVKAMNLWSGEPIVFRNNRSLARVSTWAIMPELPFEEPVV